MSAALEPSATQHAKSLTIIERQSEHDIYLVNTDTTQQSDPETARLLAQMESLTFQTRLLVSSRASAISLQSSIHICQTYTIICAFLAGSFNPGFRSMTGFYECGIPVTYMAVWKASRLFLQALLVYPRVFSVFAVASKLGQKVFCDK